MLEWDDGTDNGGAPITHYEIWYKEPTDLNYAQLDPSVVKKSKAYAITTLKDGSTYFFKIKSCNYKCCSVLSGMKMLAYTHTAPPSVPLNL